MMDYFIYSYCPIETKKEITSSNETLQGNLETALQQCSKGKDSNSNLNKFFNDGIPRNFEASKRIDEVLNKIEFNDRINYFTSFYWKQIFKFERMAQEFLNKTKIEFKKIEILKRDKLENAIGKCFESLFGE